MECGLGLLKDIAKAESDFILPRFSITGEVIHQPMPYSESAALTRAVISELRVPYYDTDSESWALAEEFLVPQELWGFWTEHSARPVCPTAAQVIGLAPDDYKFLGRWSPGGAEDYARSFRIVVQNIQVNIWKAVLSADARLLEHDVVDRIGPWGEARDWAEDKTAGCKAALLDVCKRFWSEIKKAGGPPEDIQIAQPAALPIVPVPTPKLRKKDVSKSKPLLIVYSRGRKSAKLHKTGGCQWTLIKLADTQEILSPLPSMYDSRCKLCWPELLKKGDGEVDSSSGGSDL
jgi:hypothetical protein